MHHFLYLIVPETWSVASTYFPIYNMKPVKYLRPGRLQIPVFLSKIWSHACTWDLACRRYLITYVKHEVLYLPPIPALPTIISSAIYTCDIAGCKYLFLHQKYETGHISEIWPPYYPPKTLGTTYTYYQYLLSYRKYETQHVPTEWPVANTYFPIQILKPKMNPRSGRFITRPKYEARRVLTTNTYSSTHNMKRNMYL